MDLIFRVHLGSIIDSFLQCLASPSMDVRASAFRACILLLERFFDSFDCDIFDEVLPGIMKAILGMLSCGHECLARGALTHLIALVTVKPEVFRPFIDDVVYSLLKIAECDLLEEETKYAGVELLSTLAESVDEDNSMITNLPEHYKSRLISVLMTMLQCIEDDPTWYNLDDSYGASAGKTKYFFLGTEFLDTVSTALGGHVVLPIIFEKSISNLQALSWKRRYAGIQAFVAVSEGCFGVMVSCLEQVTSIILAVFRDPHPRVRWVAIDSVIRLVQDIGAEFLAGYCTRFLPALAAALEDFDNPRVLEHAASLIQTLSEHCGQDALHPCLELIVRKLQRLLQSGKHLLQVKALVCLASVVSSSQVMEFLISQHQTHLEIDKSVESHIAEDIVYNLICPQLT
ncbi:Importin repeat 4, partial [Dillenia turbinata]